MDGWQQDLLVIQSCRCFNSRIYPLSANVWILSIKEAFGSSIYNMPLIVLSIIEGVCIQDLILYVIK